MFIETENILTTGNFQDLTPVLRIVANERLIHFEYLSLTEYFIFPLSVDFQKYLMQNK
jgi:hypothetical protein